MSLSRNYRWVVFGKLSVRNNINAPDGVRRFGFSDLEAVIVAADGDADCTRVFQNGNRCMWCAPVQTDDNYLAFLLQTGDKSVADPAFVNLTTLEARNVEKGADEGEHFCAHILISRHPDVQGRHAVLIEKVPGINLTSLKAHLNWLMARDENKNSVIVEDQERNYRGVVELDGFQSRTLQSAMETGRVLDVSFVSHERLEQGQDEDDLFRDVHREMKWEVGRRLNGDQVVGLIRRGIETFIGWEETEEKPEFLIRIETAAGQIKTVDVPVDVQNDDVDGIQLAVSEALEGALVLNEAISGFDEPLTQVYDGLRLDVTDKMKEKYVALEG